MLLALKEASLAVQHDDVPVGALALCEGNVIARRHNEREKQQDPTAHAEMLVLRDAAKHMGSWHLDGVTLVCSLEPCVMCAGAIVAARAGRLVYGAADPKAGACESLFRLCSDPRLNHRVEITGGIMAEESGLLLKTFFRARRDR